MPRTLATARQLVLTLPTDVPNLQIWLDANDPTTLFQSSVGVTPVVANDDPVGYWGDKSGGGRNALQATAGKRFLYKTNIQNSLPAIRSDGVDDFLQTANFTLNQPVTIYIALIRRGTSDQKVFFDGRSGITVRLYGVGGGSGDSLRINAGSEVGSATISSATAYIFTVLFNGANSYLRRNNSAYSFVNPGGSNPGGLTLGSNNSGGAQFVNCDYLEVIIYSRVLQNTEDNFILSYLNGKWGVY